MKKSIALFAGAFALGCLQFLVGCCGNDAYSAAERAYQKGDYEKAIELFTQAAEESDNPAIYGNRGNCYSNLGNLDAALKDYETAIRKVVEVTNDPNDPRLAYIYYNRGHAYERAGKFELAIPDYEKTISLDADYPDVRNNLAWVLATCPDEKLRNSGRAVSIAQAECEKSGWKDPLVLDTLAAAHAAGGEFAKAIERQQQAVDMTDDDEIKKDLQTRLDLYHNKKPYIESATNE